MRMGEDKPVPTSKCTKLLAIDIYKSISLSILKSNEFSEMRSIEMRHITILAVGNIGIC